MSLPIIAHHFQGRFIRVSHRFAAAMSSGPPMIATDPKSLKGHSRRFGDVRCTSADSPEADEAATPAGVQRRASALNRCRDMFGAVQVAMSG